MFYCNYRVSTKFKRNKTLWGDLLMWKNYYISNFLNISAILAVPTQTIKLNSRLNIHNDLHIHRNIFFKAFISGKRRETLREMAPRFLRVKITLSTSNRLWRARSRPSYEYLQGLLLDCKFKMQNRQFQFIRLTTFPLTPGLTFLMLRCTAGSDTESTARQRAEREGCVHR